ncbi:MAG: T9SS type A sorting domain-containing protein [Sphingobacteriaceae bacterium]|nr:T9SS type A sorting domain-containing protein [Sphingobacteriaceae bacterium]
MAKFFVGQCPPHVDFFTHNLSRTLTCNNPTLLASGTSTTNNTELSWIVPSTPSLINSPTIIIGSQTGPPTSTSTLIYAQYTLVATNTLLSCSTTSVIQIYQNFKPPTVNIAISIATPTTICNNSFPVLTTGTSISIGLPWPFLNNPCWSGPPPQTYTCGPSSYTCNVPGIYSLTLTDYYNGCSGSDTINVKDTRPQFGLQGSAPTSSLNCDGSLIVTTQIPNGYTLSASSGSLNGTTLNNLCYGWVKLCMTFTDTQCYKCDSILMNEATAIKEINPTAIGLEEQVLIYPNPTNSDFFIENKSNENLSVKIYNVDGESMEAEALEAGALTNTVASYKTTKIKAGNLENGLYILELKIDTQIIRKKILIQK